MSDVAVSVARVVVLGLVGVTSIAVGFWVYFSAGLLLGLLGPFLGLSLLGYTGYYVRTLI